MNRLLFVFHILLIGQILFCQEYNQRLNEMDIINFIENYENIIYEKFENVVEDEFGELNDLYTSIFKDIDDVDVNYRNVLIGFIIYEDEYSENDVRNAFNAFIFTKYHTEYYETLKKYGVDTPNFPMLINAIKILYVYKEECKNDLQEYDKILYVIDLLIDRDDRQLFEKYYEFFKDKWL